MRPLVCALLVLASLAPLALSPTPTHAAWYNPGYLFKKSVTVDHTKVVANRPAPAVTFMEPGTDATQDGSLYTADTCTSSAAFAHTGPRSISCGNGQAARKTGILSDAGNRISFYVYIQSFPSADEGLAQTATAADVGIYRICLSTTTHKLFSGKGGCAPLLSTGGTVLSASTWYHISLSYTVTSGTVNEFRLLLNGSPEISDSNVTTLNTASNELDVGRITGAGGVATINYDDIYVDNGSDLSDPGDIRVTAKRPNANGALNNWTTRIGAGGSGYGTGHSPQVNEQPLNQTNGWSIGTTNTRENYGIEGAATGDVDVSAKAIVADEAWVWASITVTTCTAQITNNGVDTPITLTTTPAIYTNAVNIHAYPINTATVGVAACSVAKTNQLYEAGMLIAYLGSGDTLTNFPVLVKEASDANLKNGGGGSVQNASGFDMIFTDSTETTKLDHEIENYVPATGEIEMWVRIPTLSAAVDTVIYLYYGNSSISTSQENKTGVWDTNYKGVWHMADNAATTTVTDSTSTGANGVNGANTSTKTSTGQVAGGLLYNGTSDKSTISTSIPLANSSFTVEAWAKETASTNALAIIFGQSDTNGLDNALEFGYRTYNSHFTCGFNSDDLDSANTYSADSLWHLWTCTYTTSNRARVIYKDGSFETSNTAGANYHGSGNSYLGDSGAYAPTQMFTGTIDEVRVSTTPRTAGWIATEYNDESSPSTFLAFGAAVGSPVAVISGISPSSGPPSGGTSVVITGTRFTGATAVTFGGTNATGYVVNSDLQITATAPTHASATVDITVTTLAGTSSVVGADQFTYVAATLTIVAPGGVALANVNPGTTSPTANAGTLTYNDTLNDATAWSVTFSATDFGAGTIPFTGFTIGVTTAANTTPGTGAVGVPTAGAASQTLAGADGIPGATYSTPITLASAAGTVQGSYSTPSGATGNTLTFVVPGTATGSGLVATAQYTITG